MKKRQSTRQKERQYKEFSKYITLIAFKTGRNIVYACLLLCAFAIYKELESAAFLTAAIALGESLMMLIVKWYLGLAGVDHKEGGITFEAAKAQNFVSTSHDDEATI